MEEIMNALKKIQKELDEQKTMIRKTGENVTEQVTQNINKILEEKFCVWEEKHKKLEERVANQEKRLYFLEKQARQRNIVFFGIVEKESSYESSYENLVNNFIKIIEENFSIKLDSGDIQEIKRIGKKGDRPRPIVVTFTTLGLKNKIFKQKGALNDTQYYMKEDYPAHVLQKRKELQQQLKIEREKGNNAIIKYDKLIILKNNNKRTLSTSPENFFHLQGHKNMQASKKKKTQKLHSSAPRSNSISEGVLKPGMLNYLVNNNTNTKSDKCDNKDKNT